VTDGWVGDSRYEVPDSIEPLVGWRSWAARSFALSPEHSSAKNLGEEQADPFLTSILQPVWWPVHEPMRARHVKGYDTRLGPHGIPMRLAEAAVSHDDNCPNAACHCGIYAWENKLSLRDDDRAWHMTGKGKRVTGRVEVWGHVIVHERGFRAQYAKVTGIIAPEDSEDGIEYLIAERYQVPIL
jgi:hypothetical protein